MNATILRKKKRKQREQLRRCSIAEARNNLAALVHKSERGEPIELTRRGEPVAVILSLEVYDRLTGSSDLMERISEFRSSHDLAELHAASAFENLRARARARKFKW